MRRYTIHCKKARDKEALSAKPLRHRRWSRARDGIVLRGSERNALRTEMEHD